MIEIDPQSPVPLFDQIKAGLQGLITRGRLRPGDQAPSVRALAVRLGVNPNTVARALRELIQEGVLESRRGDGTYVSAQAPRKAQNGWAGATEKLEETLRHAHRSGLSWGDIEATLKRIQKEEP